MYGYFNPRSHEGSDLVGSGPWRYPPDFNPRSHEGSDDGVKNWEQNLTISIHAPTRGATRRRSRRLRRLRNFNPRSHEGSDTFENPECKLLLISIHAPTRGATALICADRVARNDFNPRSHEGSDRQTSGQRTLTA